MIASVVLAYSMAKRLGIKLGEINGTIASTFKTMLLGMLADIKLAI